MSTNPSSKQFRQDINSLFSKLHSILSGLEAKIIERDESLREEIKQEVIDQVNKFYGSLTSEAPDRESLVQHLRCRLKSSPLKSCIIEANNENPNEKEAQSTGSSSISSLGSYSSTSSINCQQFVGSTDSKLESNCFKCSTVCSCSHSIQLPYSYAKAISHTSRSIESNPKSEARLTVRGLTSNRDLTNICISSSAKNKNTDFSSKPMDIKPSINLSFKDDKIANKDNNIEAEQDDPVSMVVPVDPNQFIGTTIKHTSSNVSDQTINLTIKAGVSSSNANGKTTSISHSVISTAKSGSICNNNSNDIANDNEDSSSIQDCDNQDQTFRTIKNSSSSNTKTNVGTSLSSSSSSNKDVNNRVKENRCPMCAQRFTQLNSLKRHIRSHTGERPFPCGYCEKRFVDRERLKVHVRIHTGEKPFSCNLCSRRFSQKSTVKRHMSVHTGLKPFQCGSCSKRFGTRDNLRVHEKSHFQVDIKFKGINNNQVQSDNLDFL